MPDEENAAVTALIKPDMQYLEWGTGGSTFTWAINTKHAYCIEHNEEWCNMVKAELEVREAANVEFHCVPVAKGHLGWGGGFEEGTYDQFAEYITKVRVGRRV